MPFMMTSSARCATLSLVRILILITVIHCARQSATILIFNSHDLLNFAQTSPHQLRVDQP